MFRVFLLSFFVLLGETLFAQAFIEIPSPFPDVGVGTVAFSDIDGDNDADLLITGKLNDDSYAMELFFNENGEYNEASGDPFIGVNRGDVIFFDMDGDGDEDALIMGIVSSSTKLFANEGGVFVEVTETSLVDVHSGHAAAEDVDGDGDNDMFLIYGGSGIDEILEFRVFNRWGEEMHNFNNFQPNIEDTGWDGRFRGDKMPPGVYIYYALIKFTDGKEEIFKGDVTLMR